MDAGWRWGWGDKHKGKAFASPTKQARISTDEMLVLGQHAVINSHIQNS